MPTLELVLIIAVAVKWVLIGIAGWLYWKDPLHRFRR